MYNTIQRGILATILRDWSYRINGCTISRLAALSVGGSTFRQLALQGLTIHPETKILDLCCGSGHNCAGAIPRML